MKIIAFSLFFNCFAALAFSQNSIYSYDENFEIEKSVRFEQVNQTKNQNVNGLWSKDYTVPGIIGTVYSSASDGTNLYVGGRFQIAGGTIANGLAKWDGQKWSSIGTGSENGIPLNSAFTDYAINAMAFTEGKLFIAGSFPKAGSVDANSIAYWDGSTWNKLGNDSLNGLKNVYIIENDTLIVGAHIHAMIAHNNKIYVGGDFKLAGGKPAKGIAAWDIQTEKWETFNSGLACTTESESVTVFSIAAWGNDLYVGGTFLSAGGVPAKHIAKWNGSEWSSVGDAESYVLDLKVDSLGKLFSTGFFRADEKTGASGLGVWNGTTWTSIKGPEGFKTSITLIQIINDEVFAGGVFESLTETPAAIGRWNGTDWNLIKGLGMASNEFFMGDVRGIEFINDKMYVAGNFTQAGSLYVVNVVEWDYKSSVWKKLDDGNANKGIHDGYIRVLEQSGNILFAGGDFHVVGGKYARNIAKWNGIDWESLGTGYDNGIRGSVYAILADGNDVYVGGYFGSAGSTEAFHLAKWDGVKWSRIGIGVGGVPGAHVRALAKVDNFLYVAGYFSVVGDEENYNIPSNSIARFNLTTNRWETLGRGIEYVYEVPGTVYDMKVFGDKILIGGEFHDADGMFFQNFAVLKNNKFSGLGDIQNIGIEGMVRTIEVINNEIYIGGMLQLERFGESSGILKWEGEKWTEIAGKLSVEIDYPYLTDIAPYKNGFIVGGYFKNAGDKEVNNIAWFDGTEWHELGGGVLPGVTNMAVLNNKVFVVGPTVMYAGEVPGIGFAHFDFNHETGITDTSVAKHNYSLHNYPNPFSEQTTISFTINTPGMVHLSIFDIHGMEIKTLLHEFRHPRNYIVSFDAGNLPNGVYFYRIKQGNNTESGKMTVLR